MLPLIEAISIFSGKYKRFLFVHPVIQSRKALFICFTSFDIIAIMHKQY